MTAKDITVTVSGNERRFTLQPFTIIEALNHIEIQERSWETAREAIKEAVGDPIWMTLSSRLYLEGIAPTVVSLLSCPADDGQALTEEEFWLLDSGDPVRVIEAQEDLAKLHGIVANGSLLMDEAQKQIVNDALTATAALSEQLERVAK